jgi:hypothetical protein
MFEGVWMPLNAPASKILTRESPPEMVSNAAAILTVSIAIAARFFMETGVSSFATFMRVRTAESARSGGRY